MKELQNAIILHGTISRKGYYDPDYPSLSNCHWFPWIQKQLLLQDIAAATPEVPLSFDPDWKTWCREVERYDLRSDTLLVGHSCGGGFWVRYLSEHPEVRASKLVLVAPWLDPDGDETRGFFDFEIDPGLMNRVGEVVIFNSDNDMGNVHKSVAMLRDKLPDVGYREFHGQGHFTRKAMGGEEFPELLETLLA